MARRSKGLQGWTPLPREKGKRLFRDPKGNVRTEYAYRSAKARKDGFRSYANQRRLRESEEFRRLSFSIKSHTPGADLSPGGDVERQITELMRHRESLAGGGKPGSGHMIGAPGDRFKSLLKDLGAEDWLLWRFWYSEVTVG